MATAAKKHLTIFIRDRHAPGAGRLEVKNAFKEIAQKTLGIANRGERIAIIQRDMKARGLRTGVLHKKSKARAGSPLYGKVYTIGGRAV